MDENVEYYRVLQVSHSLIQSCASMRLCSVQPRY